MSLTSALETSPPFDTASDAGSKPRLRLLIVVRGAESYGTETKMFGLLESLVARNAAVSLYSLGSGRFVDLARSLPSLPLTIAPVTPPRFEAGRSSRLMAYARTMSASVPFMHHLRTFLRHSPCDAIIFCEHGLALQIGVVARMAGIRAFWVMANAISGNYPLDLNRRAYLFSFRHLAIVPVANSEYTRRTLGRGAPYADKIDLGINPDRIAVPVALPAATRRYGDEIQLLVMSRLVEAKGHLVLLKALLSSEVFQTIHLTICGGPLGTPYADALTREASAHNASQRLHLLGPVADVARYYSMADVVVSSRLDAEPFGLSIIEAMLMKKPVLANASGAPADTVLDGITGWHITAPTVAAFAAGLSRMLQDRAKWAQMGRAGAERVRKSYTHHTMTDQLLGVIAERLPEQ